MIRVTGLVMLGKTKPEQRRTDGRTFVCSAGWHPDLGLIRIYPLAVADAPQDWGVYDVDLERNPRDNRPESWRIAAGRHPADHPRINQQFTRTGTVSRTHRAAILDDAYQPQSLHDANSARRSLAVLHTARAHIEWDTPAGVFDHNQLALFQEDDLAVRLLPRVVFTDRDGHQHRLQMREWGLHELVRKVGAERAAADTARALHLHTDSPLLVGNMNNQRTAWLAIKVLPRPSAQQLLDIA